MYKHAPRRQPSRCRPSFRTKCTRLTPLRGGHLSRLTNEDGEVDLRSSSREDVSRERREDQSAHRPLEDASTSPKNSCLTATRSRVDCDAPERGAASSPHGSAIFPKYVLLALRPVAFGDAVRNERR